ncbi:MAG: alcohol dehydrogenase class IV [Arcticibacterium sp.]|jgi:alcohol dehydrogenase class IV
MRQHVIEAIEAKDLKVLLESMGTTKVFLVTGKQSFFDSGAKKFIDAAMANLQYTRFFEFDQNPKYEEALIGVQRFLESKCDLIIAIGGGSVIDMAKLINVFSANIEIDPMELVLGLKTIEKKGVKFVAIPTTGGTGSEATHFAVVYHKHKKFSVADKKMLPDVIGLNEKFLSSQSAYLIACAGMDAISQAIESKWSVNSTEESRTYAAEAIVLMKDHLVKGARFRQRSDLEKLLKGAYLAGRAINISKTTAPHAVSYTFTSQFGIPHGHAVFLTLPDFLVYNYSLDSSNCNDPRGVDFVKKEVLHICGLLGVKSANQARDYLIELAKSLDVEIQASKLGLTNFANTVARNVNLERLGNNPRRISKDQLVELLEAL